MLLLCCCGIRIVQSVVDEGAMVAKATTLGLAVTSVTSGIVRCYGFLQPMVTKLPKTSVSTYSEAARRKVYLCLFARRQVSTRGKSTVGEGEGEGEGEDGEKWDSWEFGSFKRNSYEELSLEKTLRDQPPVRLPSVMGGGTELLNEVLGAKTTSTDLEQAIDILKSYLTEDRTAKMAEVLAQRTGSTAVVFENPSNPNNVWACLRTLDSFGVQNAHVVSDPRTYTKKARRQTMCSAMGSQKWLTLHGHETPEEAVAKLKADGYRVVASDLSPSAVPIDQINWSVPTAIVLGNEERGISQSMRSLADETFAIPMRGFAQSFNMSVACSVILAHLSAIRALKHGDLTEDERRRITAGWLMQCVRGSDGILRRYGIAVPPDAIPNERVAGFSVR